MSEKRKIKKRRKSSKKNNRGRKKSLKIKIPQKDGKVIEVIKSTNGRTKKTKEEKVNVKGEEIKGKGNSKGKGRKNFKIVGPIVEKNFQTPEKKGRQRRHSAKRFNDESTHFEGMRGRGNDENSLSSKPSSIPPFLHRSSISTYTDEERRQITSLYSPQYKGGIKTMLHSCDRFLKRLEWEKIQGDAEIRNILLLLNKRIAKMKNEKCLEVLNELKEMSLLILNSTIDELKMKYKIILENLERINKNEREYCKKGQKNLSSSSGHLNKLPFPQISRKLMFTFTRIARILKFISGQEEIERHYRQRSQTVSPKSFERMKNAKKKFANSSESSPSLITTSTTKKKKKKKEVKKKSSYNTGFDEIDQQEGMEIQQQIGLVSGNGIIDGGGGGGKSGKKNFLKKIGNFFKIKSPSHGNTNPNPNKGGGRERKNSSKKSLVLCRICEELIASEEITQHSKLCKVKKNLNSECSNCDERLRKIKSSIEKRINLSNLKKMRPLAEEELLVLPEIALLAEEASKVQYTVNGRRKMEEFLVSIGFIEKNTPKIVVMTKTNKKRYGQTVPIYVKRVQIYLNKKLSVIKKSIALAVTPSSIEKKPNISIKDFEILGLITRGAYGRVFLTRKKTTGDLFAIKVLEKFELSRKNESGKDVENDDPIYGKKSKARNIIKETSFMIKASNPILLHSGNPFVVNVYYSFEGHRFWYIVMDYCPGGDLFSMLVKEQFFDEEKTKQYIAELILALEFLRSRGIIHRDLKPDNILIDKTGHIKLTDFGLSEEGLIDMDLFLNNNVNQEKMFRQEGIYNQLGYEGEKQTTTKNIMTSEVLMSPTGLNSHFSVHTSQDFDKIDSSNDGEHGSLENQGTSPSDNEIIGDTSNISSRVKIVQGTPDYLSPEILLGKEHSYEVDYWSLGVILFYMSFGYPPFNDDTPDLIFNNILNGEINWPENIELYDLNEHSIELIKELLVIDPKKRLGSRSVQDIKDHKWFEGMKMDNIEPSFVPELINEEDTKYFEPRKKYFPLVDDKGKPLLFRDSSHNSKSFNSEFSFFNYEALEELSLKKKTNSNKTKNLKPKKLVFNDSTDSLTATDPNMENIEEEEEDEEP